MICVDCVTPQSLKRFVLENGHADTCNYCGSHNIAVAARLVFDYIFQHVRENFAAEGDLSQSEYDMLYEGKRLTSAVRTSARACGMMASRSC